MNLRVLHEDGRIETIAIEGEVVRIVSGHNLDRLVSGNREHFFTKDGFYDGWGMAACYTPGEAGELIEAIERRRER